MVMRVRYGSASNFRTLVMITKRIVMIIWDLELLVYRYEASVS